MNLNLPPRQIPIAGPDGLVPHEWYKPLAAISSAVSSTIAGTIYADTGSVNAIVIKSGAKALTKALIRYLVPAHTNTSTTVTLNDSGLGAEPVIFPNGTLPAIGQIVGGQTLEVVFSGVAWEIQGLQPANQSVPGSLTVAGVLTLLGALDAPTAGTAGQPLVSAGAGIPPVWQAGFTGTITTAKLTTATGSMTFANGLLISQVAAT